MGRSWVMLGGADHVLAKLALFSRSWLTRPPDILVVVLRDVGFVAGVCCVACLLCCSNDSFL